MKEPFLKRPFDFLLSLTGIILSSPLWILIGLLIIIEDGLPIFYGQERVGELFSMEKFSQAVLSVYRELA